MAGRQGFEPLYRGSEAVQTSSMILGRFVCVRNLARIVGPPPVGGGPFVCKVSSFFQEFRTPVLGRRRSCPRPTTKDHHRRLRPASRKTISPAPVTTTLYPTPTSTVSHWGSVPIRAKAITIPPTVPARPTTGAQVAVLTFRSFACMRMVFVTTMPAASPSRSVCSIDLVYPLLQQQHDRKDDLRQ